MKSLSEFPRVTLAHKPTPLDAMERLGRLLGGHTLFVKRDDCTGLAMGGNKARQLEFYFGDAVSKGATTILVTGAVQSNYVRSVAAAAAKLGLECEVQLENRVKGMGDEYQQSGNVLLNRLFGATIHTYPEGEDESGADRSLENIAEKIKERGRKPYVIHLAVGHPPLGALGYVEATNELLNQLEERGASLDAIIVPSGSALTHAGILVGLDLHGRNETKVYGICVRRNKRAQAERVFQVASQTAELLNFQISLKQHDIMTFDDYLEPGYGHPSPDTIEAIKLGARTEGLLLDPVYSGKAFTGLIGLSKQGVLKPGTNIVFLHTGGTPALFVYQNHFINTQQA